MWVLGIFWIMFLCGFIACLMASKWGPAAGFFVLMVLCMLGYM